MNDADHGRRAAYDHAQAFSHRDEPAARTPIAVADAEGDWRGYTPSGTL